MIGKWFNEGTEAYSQGVAADACPYPIGTDQESEWLAGWAEAKGVVETGQSGASIEPLTEGEEKE